MERNLVLPEAATNGGLRWALIFLERVSNGTIEAALAIELPEATPQRVALENADEVTILVLLYERTLAELAIAPGIVPPAAGAGTRPVETPALALRMAGETED